MRSQELNRERLISQAETTTGLSAWGDDRTFLVGLDRLIDAVEHMSCAARIREAVATQCIGLLATRLRLEDDARRYPEILLGRIERPLVVTGLPRTGTTWLHELLALDPANRAPLDWEVAIPSPPPEAASFESDARIGQVQASYDAMLAAVPELATMHNFHAQLPQECNAILALHFASSSFWASFAVPRYIDWLTHARVEGAFATHRRVLQQLGWHGPAGRWTLKSPPHLLMLPDLLDAYPDACVVQTHREPAKIVASLSNMIRALRRARFPDVPELLDAPEIARSVWAQFGESAVRATRDRENADIDARFFDVAYRDLVAQPVETVHRIYDRFHLEWSGELERRLDEHVADQRATGHGKHHYDASEFRIEDLDLPNQATNYRARFGDLLSDS